MPDLCEPKSELWLGLVGWNTTWIHGSLSDCVGQCYAVGWHYSLGHVSSVWSAVKQNRGKVRNSADVQHQGALSFIAPSAGKMSANCAMLVLTSTKRQMMIQTFR